ncbi:TonB-dependent siderophore receptor [Roseateles asaccharophilus]|uniref:Outer membrane receptor for ferric coprogen and ferric-rhodotorulic acid n=1 Tax=Roseateles asaccharophilus TaxID=582607 RepID=A0ABU2A2V3_9BURK|nr:TonB-dependent siderophore receptor [Roseateles asaccharophilus]MDR7331511.1 outer membrane receptor for ferric coprogen and ferric-rhodotorulic acid [Roseateles asaccharophilus]
MKNNLTLTAIAVAAACATLGDAQAQAATQNLESVVVTGKRANRVSKGATGLPMELKETPQTISTLDKEDLANFGLSGSNEALGLATGINVEQYETNRATFNARGFEIQLTQLDGLGMTNSWGTVVGREDTFLFDKIELIRGANGLLTGVGNSSGTINYVRKRPTNQDGGEAQLTFGSWNKKRAALDYNKVLSADGSSAARLVVAHEDKDSYLRDLKDERTTVYGVIDGQIGDNGVLTAGLTVISAKQDSPMWGSLTLLRTDGTQADLPVGTSTSQKWTFWDTNTYVGFLEYTHRLGADWEAKVTYNRREGDEATQLFYAYSPTTGMLNPDNTGLSGWPYRSLGSTENTVIDANISGQFSAFGRKHKLLVGWNRSNEETRTDSFAALTNAFLPLPALPYNGDSSPEPTWGARTLASAGEQTLTRFYAASQLSLTDSLKSVVGVNAVRLVRGGGSRYGAGGQLLDPKTEEVSPYLGFTYDITPDLLGYVSYSDIFAAQEQSDINGNLLAPVKGVNTEVGIKAEWLDKQLLTTLAVFTAKQQGLATYAGTRPEDQTSYYEPKDVNSEGVEIEASGRIAKDTRVTLGYTHLKLTGPDGKDIYEWVPRNTVNFRVDSRLPMLPALKLGVAGRWQSDVYKVGSVKQPAYVKLNAFAAYDVNDRTTLRLNVDNLTDKKAIGGIAYGAIYIPPRSVGVTLAYKL